MRPSEALSYEFTKTIRQRGDHYLRAGAVEIAAGSPTEVGALVQGSDVYAVSIVRHDEGDGPDIEARFDVSCSCPYFVDRFEPCKHIWAALLAGEREGHLFGAGTTALSRANSYLSFSDPLTDEAGTAGAFDVGAADTREAASRARYSGPSPSQVFLMALERRLHADALAQPASAARAAAMTEPLIYALERGPSVDPQPVTLHVLHRKPTKKGPGKPKILKLAASDIPTMPEADQPTLAMLLGATQQDAYGWNEYAVSLQRPATFVLAAVLADKLLPALARAGRLWRTPAVGSTDLTQLAWDDGPAWHVGVQVTENDTGYRLNMRLRRADVTKAVHDPAEVDLVSETLLIAGARLARRAGETGDAVLHELQRSGPIDVPHGEASQLAPLLSRSSVDRGDLPPALRVTEVRVPPTPRLTLRLRPGGTAWLGHVSFDYDGTVITRAPAPIVFDAARMASIHRDLAAEAEAAARLTSLGLVTTWDVSAPHPVFVVPMTRMAQVARELIAAGWQVDAAGSRYRVPGPVTLSLSSGIDWFDLNGAIDFGLTDGVPLTEILTALRAGERTIRLGDGTTGLLPDEWLKQYGTIAATGEISGDRIRFRRSQAALLDALLAERDAQALVTVDATFERVRHELASFSEIAPVDPVDTFQGTLRPYQGEGLGWFEFLRRFGFGGCLADDMGLGKTIMVLALLEARRRSTGNPDDAHRPSLIVVPRSLIENWRSEAARFTPQLRVLDCSHAGRTLDRNVLAAHDVALVTYGTLRRDIEALATIEFDYAILDEAQAVKNAATAAAKAVRLLQARHRLALSGTPIENHLGELWSLFEFLNPGLLGASTLFQRTTATPDEETTRLLSRGLRPFILRRTKAEVASDLPSRTEQTIVVELGRKERALYDGLRRHYRDALLTRVDREGLAKSKMHVLEALLRLRQAACHPSLVDQARAGATSAKFEALLPRLRELRAEGHKALVFSQFTSLLALLRRDLDKARVAYEYLDGRTKARAARVERFQTDPNLRLFLISLKAGGVGLNLTAAAYVFLLDPWWNPAVEAQAIDRTHRIGQSREVFAYRIIAKDTVEEKVLQLQQSKRAIADAVLAADAVGLRRLQREDLELLLS